MTVDVKAAVFEKLGGAEVIELKTVKQAPPGAGEIQIKVNAIGLNRSEAMWREGWHPLKPNFPSRIGYEAAGVVDAVGPGVTGFFVGDRVSTLPIMELNAFGAYAERFNAPIEYVVPSPKELSDEDVAALWSSYMTAYGMVIELVKVEKGDWAVVTAASSSLGAPVIQMLKMLGAKVIATTRGRDKADAVRAMGADHVIVTGEEDLVARVNEITGGAGANFAFDPIAGPIIETLAELMAPYGTIVLYGVLDFAPVNVPVMQLLPKNLSLLGYAMYLADRPERNARNIAFIRDGVAKGQLKPIIGKRFALDDIREACAYLDSMAQIGKVVVLPKQG